MDADRREMLRNCTSSLDSGALSFRSAVSPSHALPRKTALRTTSCFTRAHSQKAEPVVGGLLNKALRYGSPQSKAPLKLVCRVLTPAPRNAVLTGALASESPAAARHSPSIRTASPLHAASLNGSREGSALLVAGEGTMESELTQELVVAKQMEKKEDSPQFSSFPQVGVAGPRMDIVKAREALLDPFLKSFFQLPPDHRPLDGFVDLAAGPSLSLQRSSAARMNSRTSKSSNTRVFMSWATLVQRCETQESNLRDLNGETIQVQQLLLQQVISSTIPRNVFKCLVSGSRQVGCSAEKLVEKRRIQNLLRRVKEHLEALGAASDGWSALFSAVSAQAFSASQASVSSAGGASSFAKQRSGERVPVSDVCAAMEKLHLWPRDLTSSDHTEVAVALAMAGSTAADRERFVERKKICKDVSRTGFVLAFEFLPSNLPEWPVPLNKLPPSCVARRRLSEAGATPIAWEGSCSTERTFERQPLSLEHAAVSPLPLSQLEDAFVAVSEGDEEALLRLDAQVLLDRRCQTKSELRETSSEQSTDSGCSSSSSSVEFLEKSPLLFEAVLVCRVALLISHCFGLDVQRSFPAFKGRTSLGSAVSESPRSDVALREGSSRSTASETTVAEKTCVGVCLLSSALETSPYSAPAQQSCVSSETPLVPSWHCAQDYLASRLVTAEELQAALPSLVSVHWIRRAVRLMVGLTVDALSPAEWVRLVFSGSSGVCCSSSDLRLSRVVERFNVMHAPLLLPRGTAQNHQRLLFDQLQRQKTERLKDRQAQLLLSSLQREREAKQDLLLLQRRLVKEEAVWRSKQTPSKLGIHWDSYKSKENIPSKSRQTSTSAPTTLPLPNASKTASSKVSSNNNGSRLRGATLPQESLRLTEEMTSASSLEMLQLQHACRHLLSCVASSRATSAFRRALAAAASTSSLTNGAARTASLGEELAASAESAGTFALDLIVLSQCAVVTLAVLQQPALEPLRRHL